MKRNLLYGLVVLLVLSMAVISSGHSTALANAEPTHYKVHPDPTARPTKVPEETATPQVKASETPLPTDTPEPTETSKPTVTEENTPTTEPSITTEPSATPTQENTATQESTSTEVTPTATEPVETSTQPSTSTPIATLTQSQTPTETNTSEPSATASATVTRTSEPTQSSTSTPEVIGTESATPKPTDTSAPTVTQSDVTQVVTEITSSVKVSNEGYEPAGNSYIVGMITIGSRKIPIGLGWVRNGSFHHALNVAGRISDNDFGIHQKFMPELSRLKVGRVVKIDDSFFRVAYIVTVSGKDQEIMNRLLEKWTTITTCTVDWKDNLVFLLKQVDERGLRDGN